ncbi:MAG: metallophosphatase family protein [Sulfurimonas sp.]|nr:metallophosphatase family protein [Sulfurimonas sp.]
MKIALISDIHSNLYYLEEVLKEIESEQVDSIYCLGDLVGYYDKPNEVIELMIKKNITCVKGNHEKYLLGELEYDKNNEDIYGIEKQRNILTTDNYTFINNLPDNIEINIDSKKFYFTHSLPDDTVKYVYDLKILDKSLLTKYDYYCFSHTHIPIISYQYGTCIVNTGSVGQPRDYTRKPSFVIIDLEQDSVILKKVNIDYKKYSNKLRKDKYNESLIKILNRGKNEKN